MCCNAGDPDRRRRLCQWLDWLFLRLLLLPFWLLDLPFRLFRRPREDEPMLAVSPDPPRVAFVSKGRGKSDVYVWDLSTQQLSRVTQSAAQEYDVAWMPDGEHVIYSVLDGGLTICRADGSEAWPLTDQDGCWDSSPSVSPDGRTVLFQRAAAYQHYRGGHRFRYDWDAYVIDVAGGPVRRLTDIHSGGGISPRWLRSGREFIYKNGPVYRCDLEGQAEEISLAYHYDLSQQHDLVASIGDAHRRYYYEVYLSELDGSDARRLAPGKIYACNPAFSPDGEWVYFHVGPHFRIGTIWRVRIDGSELAVAVPRNVLRRPWRYLRQQRRAARRR